MCVFRLTINGGQHDSGVIVSDDVCIAVLGLVDLQVGVFPGELLAGVNRLQNRKTKHEKA